MQTFTIDQVKQQREFIDRQEKKDAKLPSVKLPKLELFPFNRNKLKWKEFWDWFECTVHKNTKLTDIEKFSYLQSKIVGEARGAIVGLALSNENYKVAINLLKERYGNNQEIVDLQNLKFAKLQYVSSSFRCRVITGSLKLRSMTHLPSYECFHCS